VEELDAYPLLIDAQGQVLSLPPIINADESKVVSGTRDLFLDATGPSLPIVERALSILATSLVELDGSGQAWIEPVRIEYPDRAMLTPELQTEVTSLDPDWACRLLGLELTRAEVAERLLRMRHGVADSGSGPLSVTSAAYRHDIMHPVDLVEDLAIAHGYHNFTPELVPTFTAGRALPENLLARQAASVLTGLGFIETLSLVLTCEDDHYEKLLRPVPDRRVRVANPVSVEQTMLREHLYSSLLSVLGGNTDHPLPQRIFEVGDVVGYPDVPLSGSPGSSTRGAESAGRGPAATGESADPAPTERRLIAGAVCATKAGYSEGRSVLDALLTELAFAGPSGEGVEYRADDNPSGLPGRSAAVYDSAGARIAELFEVHPQVLENFGLPNPVVLFSLELGVLEH
jgi:phenylalanyl-tRNA synthetase beta chain